MTEYWKSNARKFCDFCKCWLTDNKPSIEFHEKGRNHQENVKRRLNEISRKGRKDFHQQQKLDREMEKMEKAAMAAFKKDIQSDPSLANQYSHMFTEEGSKEGSAANVAPQPSSSQVAKPPNVSAILKKRPPKSDDVNLTTKIWYEAVSEEGHTYYWNIYTNESRWDEPDEYMTLDEQETENLIAEFDAKKAEEEKIQKAEDDIRLKHKFAVYRNKIAAENEDEQFTAVENCNEVAGPVAKADPYGGTGWQPVPQNVKEVDLQLPKTEVEYTEVIVPKQDERVKFKEKTFASANLGTSSESVGFKKRKNNSSFKRNIRRRGDDDDAS